MFRIAFLIAVPFLALLLEGLARKMVARARSSAGPPILQPFYDIAKLLRKRTLKTHNDIFFMAAPFLYLASIYALFLFVPFPVFGFAYDFMFVIYLTILASAFYVLAGASSDSPYGVIGSMREMTLVVVHEMVIAIVIFNVMLSVGVVSFSALGIFQPELMALQLPLSAFCLLAVVFVELRSTPFYSPDAGPEMLTGADVEYSAKNLAFFELAKYMKNLFFAFLAAMLFVGTRNLVWFGAAFLAVYCMFVFSQVATSHYSMRKAKRIYLFLLAVALIDFILVSRGIL